MRIDSGNAHLGFATGPLPRPPVDFTSGSIAWRRASFASGREVGFFFAERRGLGISNLAGMYIATSRPPPYSRALITLRAPPPRYRHDLLRDLAGHIHPASFTALDLQLTAERVCPVSHHVKAEPLSF